ncbi:FAD-dependent oxidoreductase [Aurantimonas endophytica]|uniref:FAD-dependent oxidoreductase n=1 Tax=Aurantimonas endophytica TaxID=1522175 RepID=UPI0016062369|nr:FAD-dependent oxidoreductase [Aurantimonas endophytica]MCO6405353.1 FAD-dependent oxidoreductase [Aurantimonas endophytica]
MPATDEETELSPPAPDRHVVLLGAGHAHVAVLKAFGERPMPGVRLSLVTRDVRTPYSGMLPGFVARLYDYDELLIDAAGLARYAGATLLRGEAIGLDPQARTLSVRGQGELGYDLLSIDIGSVPNRAPDAAGIPVKPIGDFVDRLDALGGAAAAGSSDDFTVAIVGTGPAGVELAFALARRLQGVGDGRGATIVLAGRDPEILCERSLRTRRRLARALADKGIRLETGFDVTGFEHGELRAADGRRIRADTVLWATESAAAPWLRGTGLALDASGFIAVDATLRSLSHPAVFAAGDIAALPDPRPKAGVFAVRQGAVLARNIRHALEATPLEPYRPQRHWLTLLSTADGRAVADKWGLSLEGHWVWRWKDWNDRRFVDGYNAVARRASL